MVCSVNHAPQGLAMCARVKFVCSVKPRRQVSKNMVINTDQILVIIFL